MPHFQHLLIVRSTATVDTVRGELKRRHAQLTMLAVCRDHWPVLQRVVPMMAHLYRRGGEDELVERVPAGPILFIDGHCVLCQRAAQWVLRHDRRRRVALAALQGKTAHRLLPAALCEESPSPASPGSLVWREGDGRIRLRSAAVLAVAVALGGWYRAGAALLWLVPAPLRDALYLALARRRRRWFGTSDRCRLPAESHGNRLLD